MKILICSLLFLSLSVFAQEVPQDETEVASEGIGESTSVDNEPPNDLSSEQAQVENPVIGAAVEEVATEELATEETETEGEETSNLVVDESAEVEEITDSSLAEEQYLPETDDEELTPAVRQASEVVNLSATIVGNQEQPTVLYIVPWKPAEDTTILYLPLSSKAMEHIFGHVERVEHKRQVQYIEQLDKQ